MARYEKYCCCCWACKCAIILYAKKRGILVFILSLNDRAKGMLCTRNPVWVLTVDS